MVLKRSRNPQGTVMFYIIWTLDIKKMSLLEENWQIENGR